MAIEKSMPNEVVGSKPSSPTISLTPAPCTTRRRLTVSSRGREEPPAKSSYIKAPPCSIVLLYARFPGPQQSTPESPNSGGVSGGLYMSGAINSQDGRWRKACPSSFSRNSQSCRYPTPSPNSHRPIPLEDSTHEARCERTSQP